MPKRWLSVRGNRETKEVNHVTQDQFDFEFVASSQGSKSPSTPEKGKANMFNGSSFRPKKTKHNSPRSQTSISPKFAVGKRLHLTKVEDSWIGVAFGSPTHPPSTMPGLPGNESTTSLKNPSHHDNSPLTSSYMSKYRKISSLFKTKPSHLTISAPTQVYRIDGDQILDMPIATKPWRSPNSPPDWVNSENPEAFTASLAGTLQESVCSNVSTSPPRPSRSTLPKLEIQIPDVQMDRYSVMFGDVPGIKPSNLLERRSRNLSGLKLSTDVTDHSLPPVPPLQYCQPRQPTTPTHQSHQRRPSYSLFPSPPKSTDKERESLERQLPRRQLSFSSRPSTTSVQSFAPQIDVIIPKAEGLRSTPERKVFDPTSISPDDTIASSERDDYPWRSTDSPHSAASSRTSFESEIFFDLKPICDASGREQSQYIFQKADSPSAELAISESRKARKASRNKKKEEEKMALTMSPDLQAAEYMLQVEEKWRLSMELNHAIEEVERLTSPFSSFVPVFQPPPLLAPPPNIPLPQPGAATRELLPSIRLRKKVSGALIGIPSPITERSEEFSPRSSCAVTQIHTTKITHTKKSISRHHTRQHIASLSIRPAPLNLSNESLLGSSPESTFAAITPPPVPIKDAKFIPISRFAGPSSNTGAPAVKLVELRPHTYRRPRKSKRSATESNITFHSNQLSSFPAPPCRSNSPSRSRERPATFSSTATITSDTGLHRPSAIPLKSLNHQQQQLLSPGAHKRVEAGIIAVNVQPMAEVSVAKTVSLERKVSQQILVTSPSAALTSHPHRRVGGGRSSVHSRSRSGPAMVHARPAGLGTPLNMGAGPMLSPLIVEGERWHRAGNGRSVDLMVEKIGN